MSKCPHCGFLHETTCPRILSIEYHPDGVTVKRIEFHPQRPLHVRVATFVPPPRSPATMSDEKAREVIGDWLMEHEIDPPPGASTNDQADAILSALAAAGLKVLAREPTAAMVAGMRDAWDYFDANDDVFRREWRGAFDAATPGAQPDKGET